MLRMRSSNEVEMLKMLVVKLHKFDSIYLVLVTKW